MTRSQDNENDHTERLEDDEISSKPLRKDSGSEIEQNNDLDEDFEFYKEKFATIPINTLIQNQKNNFIMIMLSFLTILLSTLMRGGSGRPSLIGIIPCSPSSWNILFGSQLISCLLATFCYMKNREILDQRYRDSVNINHERRLRKKLFVASYITGFASGAVGVGGGMLLSIYMLSLGIDVLSAGAMSIFAILFSSLSTTFQSVIAGEIRLRHAYAVMIMSLIGAVIGNCCMKNLIKKYNKSSFILIVLGVFLILAAVVIPLQMIDSMISTPKAAFSFGRFC